MITDEKRREVAARLRGLDDSVKAEIESRMARLSNKDLAATLVSALGLATALAGAGFDTRTGGDFWELMADLMDTPTAHAIQRCPGAFYECGACGQDAWTSKDKVTLFCPHCGARVINDNVPFCKEDL